MKKPPLREGTIAGVLGATSVAVWFFVADIIVGTPFHTPLLLASAVASVFGGHVGDGVLLPVIGYTVLHFVTFIIVGIIVAELLAATRHRPGHLAGLFLLFAVFETGFYGLCMMLSKSDILGSLAWYQIGAANLLASVVVGTFLWRRHPEAVRGLDAALKGLTP